MATSDLVTRYFVEAIYGSPLDAARCDLLISTASDIVREHTGQAWDDTTCPTTVKVIVAQMVGDVFRVTPGDEAAVKAEQIGEYRVEYARAALIALTTGPYEKQLAKWRLTAYSITTGVPFDGEADEAG